MGEARQRIVVVGAGGHGHVVVDALRSRAEAGTPFHVVAIVDEAPTLHGSTVGGVMVAGNHGAIATIPHDAIVVAIGHNATRRRVQEQLVSAGARLLSVIHPAAVVSREAVVEPGAVVCAGAVVGPLAHIGEGAIINTLASVDHHCDVGAFAHIAPGAKLAGGVSVGIETLVGMGAALLPGVRIGARATIGAGGVVIADVADGETVVGVPARVVSVHIGR